MNRLFTEERHTVNQLETLMEERPLTKAEVVLLIEKLKDIIDVSSVAINMIDNLAQSHRNGLG